MTRAVGASSGAGEAKGSRAKESPARDGLAKDGLAKDGLTKDAGRGTTGGTFAARCRARKTSDE